MLAGILSLSRAVWSPPDVVMMKSFHRVIGTDDVTWWCRHYQDAGTSRTSLVVQIQPMSILVIVRGRWLTVDLLMHLMATVADHLLLLRLLLLLIRSQEIHAELWVQLIGWSLRSDRPSTNTTTCPTVLSRIASGAWVALFVDVRETVTAVGSSFGRQDFLECQSEIEIENGINDGIKSAVGIAQPSEYLEHNRRDTCLAEGGHNVDTEKGNPTDEKHSHNDAQSDGRLVIGDVVIMVSTTSRRCCTRSRWRGWLIMTSFLLFPFLQRLRGLRLLWIRCCTGGLVRIRLETAQQDDRPSDGLNVLDVHFGVKVESRVDGQHDQTRKIETDARRHDGVSWRQVQRALMWRRRRTYNEYRLIPHHFRVIIVVILNVFIFVCHFHDRVSVQWSHKVRVGVDHCNIRLSRQSSQVLIECRVQELIVQLQRHHRHLHGSVEIHGNGQERNEGRQKPNSGDGTVNDTFGHPATVAQRILDVNVPITNSIS